MAKMDKKWVILCSTAIAAVYASGYVTTEAQANKLNAQPQAQVSMQTKTSHAASGTSNQSQTAGAQSNNTSTTNNKANTTTAQASPAQTKQMYKDGTFTGTGQNRRGGIQVAVTFKNDKITDVQISDFEMHYAESDIADLPSQVVQRQSAQVDNVTGATYSTMAFADAVQDAINQAKNS